MKQWCISIRLLKDEKERESAYRGFCQAVPISTKAAVDNFPILCSCLSHYK